MKKNTARVIVTQECSRNCSYCVNKQNDGEMIRSARHFTLECLTHYEMVLLTGGEPLLKYTLVLGLCDQLRRKGYKGQIIIYASRNLIPRGHWIELFKFIDGVTYTIHDENEGTVSHKDMDDLHDMQTLFRCYPQKSFRLNLAPTLESNIPIIPEVWGSIKIKKWLEDCPLPTNETLYIIPEGD